MSSKPSGPAPSPSNHATVHEAQKEIQKAADKYFRAHDSNWLRKPSFRFTIEPVIDPTKVTVVIPEAFPEFKDPEKLFLRILLIRLQLRQITFNISTAISTAISKISHPYRTDLLRQLHFWI